MTPDDSNSLENARNQVFRMCRYGFKKIRRKNIDFSQSYDVDKKSDNFFVRFLKDLTKSLREQKAPKI